MVQNPFNGIESQREPGVEEFCNELQNPFNGIERVACVHERGVREQGIHSMELKGSSFLQTLNVSIDDSGIHSMELKDTRQTTANTRTMTRIHSMELKGRGCPRARRSRRRP